MSNIKEIVTIKILQVLLSHHILIIKKVQFLEVRTFQKKIKVKIYFKVNTNFLKINKRFAEVLKRL